MFPCPGVISERHYYFHVEVDPASRAEPSLDGSALEAGGVVVAIPLAEALRLISSGQLADAKTEIALRRLAELP
jgi:ADP-ribose pyrophosphatase